MAAACVGCIVAGSFYGMAYEGVHDKSPYTIAKERLDLKRVGQHYLPKKSKEPFFFRFFQYSNSWVPTHSYTNGFTEDCVDSWTRHIFGTPKILDPLRCVLISTLSQEEIEALIDRRKRDLGIDLLDKGCPNFFLQPDADGNFSREQISYQWKFYHDEVLPNYKKKISSQLLEKRWNHFINQDPNTTPVAKPTNNVVIYDPSNSTSIGQGRKKN